MMDIIEICRTPKTIKEIYGELKPNVSYEAVRKRVYRLVWHSRDLLRFYDEETREFKYLAMKYAEEYINKVYKDEKG